MKNLVYKIALITLTTLSFKLAADTNSKIPDKKESIRYAIKKSKPDLLKEALVGVELTEKEKNWFSMFANEVMQMRKNKMNLNLIKPERKFAPSADYFFAAAITFLFGSSITCGLLREWAKEEFRDSTIIVPIITGTATFLAIKKLMAIGNKKNQEYFALHPYRSPKQKYLYSIDILELIQSN